MLRDEVVRVVREIGRQLSGDGVQVIRAAAGTGKTRALSVARTAWERSDMHVYGCSLAARAAVELESLAGIDSTTVARFERDLDEGHGLRHGSVLVVDEAGMVGTRSIARLAAHCAETDSKLLLVGDDHQLPEIDAGGAFRRLANDLGAVELRTVRRQSHAWDRAALDDLRHGRVAEWAERYRDEGRLVADPTAAGTRRRLVEDWWLAARAERTDAVMIAHRRVDVAELNSLARQLMHDEGRLADDELVADGRAFSVGDRVLVKQNDRRLNVVNGSRAEVASVDLERRTLEVRLADKTTRSLDSSFLDRGALMHGYALTAHAAQGATVDQAYVLGSDDLYREWGYTALTRHRAEARFYVVSPGTVERALPGLEPEPDPLTEDVVAAFARSGRKSTAHDVLDQGLKRRTERPVREPLVTEPAGPSPEEVAATEAAERAAALEAELVEVKPWQRKRGSALQESLARQRADVLHWTERVAESERSDTSRTTLRPTAAPLTNDEIRLSLLRPSAATVASIGERPEGIAGRDRWLRVAVRLVSDPTLAIDTAVPERTMGDTGLEL